MANILICDDIKVSAQMLAEEAKKDNQEVLVLSKEMDGGGVFDNLERALKDFEPKYLITDSLNGKCFEAIEKARRIIPGIIPILYTSYEHYRDLGKNLIKN